MGKIGCWVLDVGCWMSGVDVDWQLCLSVVVICCWLIGCWYEDPIYAETQENPPHYHVPLKNLRMFLQRHELSLVRMQLTHILDAL